MAKRKRLTPPVMAQETDTIPADLEVKSLSRGPMGDPQPARAPIAQVAGDAAHQAALEEISAEMHAARAEGRLVQQIALSAIHADHLVRDRMVLDAEEMDSLTSSLRARGQQTPIEVVARADGSYGLISGWRRLRAFKALHRETGDDRFASIQALIKPLDDAGDAYLAMVEENEVRASLSFYERARLAAEAAKLGIYPTPERAVQTLFAAAPSAKRSKIIRFLKVHEALDGRVQYPAAIPEKLGLGLAKAIEDHPGFTRQVREGLRKAACKDAGEERAFLEHALAGAGKTPQAGPKRKRAAPVEVAPGIRLAADKGRLVISGKGVTEDLQAALTDWLSRR